MVPLWTVTHHNQNVVATVLVQIVDEATKVTVVLGVESESVEFVHVVDIVPLHILERRHTC